MFFSFFFVFFSEFGLSFEFITKVPLSFSFQFTVIKAVMKSDQKLDGSASHAIVQVIAKVCKVYSMISVL